MGSSPRETSEPFLVDGRDYLPLNQFVDSQIGDRNREDRGERESFFEGASLLRSMQPRLTGTDSHS